MRTLLRTVSTTQAQKLAQHSLAIIGVMAFGYCLAVFLDANFYQTRVARKFAIASDLRVRKGADATHFAAKTKADLPENGALIGRLEIPRIGVSVIVVEGSDDGNLRRAVGHIPGTALPEEPGNVGIAGHRDTFFRPLRSAQRGDNVTLSTLEGTYRYRVVSTKVVAPEDIQVLRPTGHDSLTLITCFPFYYVGPASKRFIVQAERVPRT
jgi:sortase A